MNETLSRLYERKKFLLALFDGIDKKEEFIRVFQCKDDFKKVTFFNDIDDLNNYVDSYRYNANTYFSLATTDGKGGTTDNLKYRYCLAWDFDKKHDDSLDAKEIMFRFKSLKLWYHALVDSGNGYHVYMFINKTDDLSKVEEVTKAIGSLLGADPDAMLKTQVLRVPLTYNLKNGKVKKVNIIKLYDRSTIKRYDINKLHKRFCKTQNEGRTIQYAMTKNLPLCIINILRGVNEGDRNFALKRLISYFKIYKYPMSEAYNIIKEWNDRNSPPLDDSYLEYQFDYIWEKDYNCFGCITHDTEIQAKIYKYCDKETCKSNSKESIFYADGETIDFEYKICKKIEKQRKNVFQLKGNHLVILGVLKNNPEGLNTEQITNKITYNGKCCMSSKTLNNVLNELAENGFVKKIKGNKRKKEKDFYKFIPINCDEVEKFNISYFAVLGVIKGNISSEDFKIYCYLRYRLSKGLSVTQDKLADELGLNQPAISKHIKKLEEEKYIEVISIEVNDSGFTCNKYKVNY